MDNCTTVLPATITGIPHCPGSGLIKGIGPRTADRIVEHLGIGTGDVIAGLRPAVRSLRRGGGPVTPACPASYYLASFAAFTRASLVTAPT
ncbi:hypothetical protein GCM10010381_56490 [Streptomyces xantholiticus]|nr:hypothetical protein GCM10010381_56490 [Streptomyces xantholiticus]